MRINEPINKTCLECGKRFAVYGLAFFQPLSYMGGWVEIGQLSEYLILKHCDK